MTKVEAIKAMLNGKMIKHSSSNTNRIWKYKNNYFVKGGLITNTNEMVLDGYEIYETPKPRVKVWQWIIKHNTPNIPPRLTTGFFATENEASNDLLCADDKIIQRADWTEIEVEVE